MARFQRPMKSDCFPVFPMHLLMDEEYEHLSREEWGSVFLLMQHQWIKEGTLPAEKKKLAGLAKCSVKELDALMTTWPKLLPVDGQADRVAIPWLLNEYKRAMTAWEEYRAKQAEKGKKGGEAKAAKQEGGSEGGTGQATATTEGGHGLAGAKPAAKPPSNSILSHPIPSSPSEASGEASSAGAPSAPHAAVVITLPCVGPGPETYGITAEEIGGWRKDFPGVDVEQQLRTMHAWLTAQRRNPKKAKAYDAIPSFIVSWLAREKPRAIPLLLAAPVDPEQERRAIEEHRRRLEELLEDEEYVRECPEAAEGVRARLRELAS